MRMLKAVIENTSGICTDWVLEQALEKFEETHECERLEICQTLEQYLESQNSQR